MMRTFDAVAERWPAAGLGVWIPLIAATLAGVAMGLAPPWVAVGVAGVLVWSWLLVRHWSAAVPLTIAVSVAIPRFTYVLGGVNVSAERVVLPVVLAVFLLRTLVVGSPLALGRAHLLLLFAIGINGVASVLNAPVPIESLRLTLLIAVASLPFWFLPTIARDRSSVHAAVLIFIAVGVLEAAFGVVAAISYVLLDINIGVQLDSLTGAWAAYGTQYEGNTFGSFVAAATAMTLGWLTSGDLPRRGRVLGWLALGVLTAGLIASLSRGAWVGAACGVVVVVLSVRQRWKIGLLATAPVAFAVLLAVTGVWQPASDSPGLAAALTRLGSLGDMLQGNFDDILIERFYTYDLAYRGWLAQPIIGWGAGALGQRFTYLTVDLPAWVGNLELHALYDSGLLGAMGLIGSMITTIVALIRVLRRQPPADRQQRAVLVGLLAGCVTLLVAFQATEATWLGYTWYVFGLAWAAARNIGHARSPLT
jgi:O-antigen ligase